MVIHFGREICGELDTVQQREWLVTNGIGGYASGTVAGLLTRHYHGILIAAIAPPAQRRLMVAKLDETAQYNGKSYSLYTNRWADGTIAPHGYRNIESFRLEGTTPVWTFACGEALLEKRIWMERGENTTYVCYTLHRASRSLDLSVKALVNYRSHHGSVVEEDWQIEPCARGLKLIACDGAQPFYLLCDRGTMTERYNWYAGFDLALEQYRRTGDYEDHLHAATLKVALELGESLTVVVSTEANPSLDGKAALTRRYRYERQLLQAWHDTPGLKTDGSPGWVQQLVLSADAFLVRRPLEDGSLGTTVLAGYPWFGDWGRWTLMSLPGLTLATGRPDAAKSILLTYSRFFQNGLLPNFFPDEGRYSGDRALSDSPYSPAYNTVDATLWYVEAVRLYLAATGDRDFLAQIFPLLAEAIACYCRGTDYGIQLDRTDGLIAEGTPESQLTWMDAKIGEWVVTPRAGKPIEVNALWYNALLSMGQFAAALGKPTSEYEQLAQQAYWGFQRFWNPSTGYCYDVLDTPDGDDATLRPNQLLAVSLPVSPLTGDRQKALVEACSHLLLTSHGLRSLSPDDPNYRNRYGGDTAQRDLAYHQGTVWAWWMGAFAIAHLRANGDVNEAMAFLSPFAHHLQTAGVGYVSEIFDGDAPMTPRGCIAYAGSVAELLRAWLAIAKYTTPQQPKPDETHLPT
ncbi:Putative glycogen debranching enzyme archaeal type TIGR01561 [Geitlerinema sp. FC II]|nr:Putative glycogen debranching enzyme archaeal type TIGR01561 [Geitlerinema sp. FC II]